MKPKIPKEWIQDFGEARGVLFIVYRDKDLLCRLCLSSWKMLDLEFQRDDLVDVRVHHGRVGDSKLQPVRLPTDLTRGFQLHKTFDLKFDFNNMVRFKPNLYILLLCYFN